MGFSEGRLSKIVVIGLSPKRGLGGCSLSDFGTTNQLDYLDFDTFSTGDSAMLPLLDTSLSSASGEGRVT